MPLDIQRLQAARPDRLFSYFPSIGSTMREAAKLVSEGAPHGSVVVAEEQTAGIGRHGRSWISEPEVGIYCSILLRLPLPPNQLPVLTLMLGLATAEALQKTSNVACDLRWPNDVLIEGRKVAGILAQLVESCVIAGIGINVNHTRLPDDLRTPATSLRLETGNRVQSRESVLLSLLSSLDSFADLIIQDGPGAILNAFTAVSSYATDRRVLIEETGVRGMTAGLDENGFLLVRTASGRLERIAAGGVRPDPEPYA